MDKIPLAHFDNKTGRKEPLCEHLEHVASRAKDYATAFNASEEAYLTGLLHDLGKYGEPFQRRLKGEESGIDHWSAGAWEALNLYKMKGIATALAIHGHHVGLQAGDRESLARLNPENLKEHHPQNRKLSPGSSDLLVRDGLSLYPEQAFNSLYEWNMNNVSSMLDVRMLFSALVDADFIETEAWFSQDETGNRKYREPGLPLEPEKGVACLETYRASLEKASNASAVIKQLRSDLYNTCTEVARLVQGLFTLSAPTGSGKTLSMLAFALTHAKKHGLKRIIIVVPYLTIIEQTVQVYQQVFSSGFKAEQLERYILEHHSLSSGKEGIEDEDYNRRRLTENWDAPIVVTTSVQFLESLFANRPSSCRKLHNLAGSVILFDEVQTLPLSLSVPTLAALARMAEKYRSTVLFSTATQPAFSHLNEFVKDHCSAGWEPREIVPAELDLFRRARRTQVNWPQSEETITWTELADRLIEYKQVLCVVNLKKHASVLFDNLSQTGVENIYHLSTNMCPAHRKVVLDEVRRLLDEGKLCRFISTQCIEAGADIDFPVVYRAMGPLEAIAQAAGRCNRNGRLTGNGKVFVFRPEQTEDKWIYPDGTYRQAAEVTELLLKQHDGRIEIDDPVLYRIYYQQLYGFTRPEEHRPELLNAIKRQDFAEVSRLYRIIDRNTINVLVPYRPNEDKEAFDRLRAEVLDNGLSRDWIRKARSYSVSMFRPRHLDDPLYGYLETIREGSEGNSSDWYIYREEEDYDKNTGLTISKTMNVTIA